MTCTAGSTRIRKINTKIFFAETEQKSTRHESNQGQANASQHLRELETKKSESLGRVKKIWTSVLTKRGTSAGSKAE
jgi:hypothetical protein